MNFRDFLSPLWWIAFLHRVRYLHFFAVGMSGVALNLAITVSLTEFVFGREQYFSAYLFGLTANLIYNFILHTVLTFKTESGHVSRLVYFLAYSIILTYIQAKTVKMLTDVFGVDWYALIIAAVILAFSVVTFVLFKFVLFKHGFAQEVNEA